MEDPLQRQAGSLTVNKGEIGRVLLGPDGKPLKSIPLKEQTTGPITDICEKTETGLDCVLKSCKEIKRFVGSLVEEQYFGIRVIISGLGFNCPSGLHPMPEESKIIETLLGMSSEEFEIVKGLKKPVILLMPITHSSRYISAFETMHKTLYNGNIKPQISGDIGDIFDDIDRENGFDPKRIFGWDVAIVEGADLEPLPGDDTKKSLIERYNWVNAYAESKRVYSIDILQYILLQINGIRGKSPLDRETYTMLSMNTSKNNFTFGCYNGDSVNLITCNNNKIPQEKVLFRLSTARRRVV